MAQMHEQAVEQRFGNLRRPRQPGLWHFGLVGTTLVFAAAIVWILILIVAGLLPAVGALCVIAPTTVLLTLPDRHGRTRAQKLGERGAAWRARVDGTDTYMSGPVGRLPSGRFALPGILAPTSLGELEDAYGRPAAMIHHHRLGRLTAVLETQPDGAALVDLEDRDQRVALWGAWQRGLAEQPGLAACTVTVETAPATASYLESTIARRTAAGAPELAREIVEQVVESSPEGAAQITGWVALSYRIARRGRRRGAGETALEIVSRLPQIASSLQPTGAGVSGPISAQRLCEVIRTAYDPAVAAALEHASAEGRMPPLRWSDVGPTYARAHEHCYEHDGAWSVTWAMTAAPAEYRNTVLARLIAPHPDIDRKRVTLIYRPIDPGLAARRVEKDLQAAELRRNAMTRPSAQAKWDVRRAESTADEHARGAGLEDVGMLVTATVLDRDRLPAAVDAIESAAGAIVLRRLSRTQSSAFAAGLPLGIDLSVYVNTPQWLQEGL